MLFYLDSIHKYRIFVTSIKTNTNNLIFTFMKTKQIIFGVLYAIGIVLFIYVGNLIAALLVFIVLLDSIALVSMRKKIDDQKEDFEKTLTNRRVAYDKMYAQAMQLTEDLKQKNDEIDLWKKGFNDLDEILTGLNIITSELFEIIDERNAEISELKPLAQSRLDYLQHERERKKTFRKANADLLKVRRFAKKYAGRIVVRKDGGSFGLTEKEAKAIVCGYDNKHDLLIVGVNSRGFINLDTYDILTKHNRQGYAYAPLTSIKLLKNETKN